ncbi:SDR family oxidoreductase [Actinacidiphila yeochonensis]|uniref:SDR family oxidoreductase n=1 Tax=Actinacidiphila yeochonensis TaxID=89050 RepID=UPI00055BEE57|nr:SDR family oxidoreductase [Actinacidiphila yeochonensis]
MRVFVTGGSGFIGSAVVPELLGAGHEVTGLARSDASAEALTAAGAKVLRGDLEDLDALRKGAAESDGVVHLAFVHAFPDFATSAAIDARAVAAFGSALEGSGRPLVIASGVAGFTPGQVATEQDFPALTLGSPFAPRAANARATLDLAEHAVRSSVVRLPPTVHGEGDHGFIALLVGIARERGAAGYVGDGAARWPAVHRSDAARLFRLALEQAPAGTVLHGVAEEGVPTRAIAESIGANLGLPAVPVAPQDAEGHFGWLGGLYAMDTRASSTRTRELLGWQPTGPGLLEDLDQGHYFTPRPAGGH